MAFVWRQNQILSLTLVCLLQFYTANKYQRQNLKSNDVCIERHRTVHIARSLCVFFLFSFFSFVFEISGMAPGEFVMNIFFSFFCVLNVFVAQKPLSDNKRLIRADISQI